MFKSISESDICSEWEKGFVRLGKPPRSKQSYNFRDQHFEKGVSVYPAYFSSNGSLRAIDLRDIDFASALSLWASKDTRGLWRVFGEEVGKGSDNEPVLKPTKSIRVKKSGIAPITRALIL